MTLAIRAQVEPDVDGARARVGLKWPNDVLLDGAKVCGILSQTVPGQPDAVVIGAGVNTRMTPEQRPVPTATSLAIAGVAVQPDEFVAHYLRTLDHTLGATNSLAEFARVRADVRGLCATLGRDVRVMLPEDRVLEGRATALDDAGHLVVTSGGESVPVAAGDVIHVR